MEQTWFCEYITKHDNDKKKSMTKTETKCTRLDNPTVQLKENIRQLMTHFNLNKMRVKQAQIIDMIEIKENKHKYWSWKIMAKTDINGLFMIQHVTQERKNSD